MHLIDWAKGKKILLASGSPRRRELISQLGIKAEVVKLQDVDETYPDTLLPEEVAPWISQVKADAYHLPLRDGEILVTADTVVILDDMVIGKPKDEADACHMLEMLSGKTHHVITGVTLVTNKRRFTFADDTEVEFTPLTAEEIAWYVENYRPLDKAGAYGIQEWIGYVGVKAIRGDFYNVMGLPLCALYAHLKEITKD